MGLPAGYKHNIYFATVPSSIAPQSEKKTQTHVGIYIYIYIYIPLRKQKTVTLRL